MWAMSRQCPEVSAVVARCLLCVGMASAVNHCPQLSPLNSDAQFGHKGIPSSRLVRRSGFRFWVEAVPRCIFPQKFQSVKGSRYRISPQP